MMRHRWSHFTGCLFFSALGLIGCETDQAASTSGTAPASASSAEAVMSATAGPTSSTGPSASSSASASGPNNDVEDRAGLSFAIEGKALGTLRRSQLVERVGVKTFTAYDPYYAKPKTYRALPLRAVLELGFAGHEKNLEEQHFVLRAKDGYTVPIEGKRLLEEGSYIAIDDVDTPGGWQPIGPQQVSPGPYYLVWEKDEQKDLTTHPRPWQLATIEISKFETTFPLTVPTGEPETAPAWAGFRLFREQCIRCHSINQQGGRVGPELNVPQNITSYRPEAQIRAYIRDPKTFRYGNMPANPHLDEDDLDSLLAYLRAMSKRQHDPGTAAEH